ncbi:hypothetical protein ACYZT2_20640 [Pseudomonas sp. MDT1-85]
MSALRFDSKTLKLFTFILYLAFFYLSLFFNLQLKEFSDDYTFLSAAMSGVPPMDYITERYHTWTGRIAIEGVMITTIGYPIFWKLAIPTCLLLSAYSTWKAFFSNTIHYSYGITLCIFLTLLISHDILDTTAFYVTGFYNYLLPVSCAVFVCTIFMRPSSFSILEKILVFPLALIASQSEQAGVSMLSIFTVSLIWDRKNALAYRCIILAVVLTGFAFLLSAPGNYIRLTSELRYMPEFTDYSILKKATTGLDVFNYHFTDPRNLYPKLLALLLTLLSLKNNFPLKKLAILLVIFGVFQSSIFGYIFNTGGDEYFSIRYLSTGLGLEYFVSYTLTLLALVSMIYIVRNVIINDEEFYFAAFLLMLYTAVTALVGLSPTAYESGYRVLLAGDIISLMFICILFKEVLEQYSSTFTKPPLRRTHEKGR